MTLLTSEPSSASQLTADDALAMTYSHSLSVERVVPVQPVEAFDKFHQFVWLRNAGVAESLTSIVEPGNPETFEGETRSAAGVVQEKILRTISGQEILYTVVAGPFPVNNHLGTVRFESKGEHETLVIWNVQYTPKCGAGLFIKLMMTAVLKLFLHQFEKTLRSSSKQDPTMANPNVIVDLESQTFTDSVAIEKVIPAPIDVAFRMFYQYIWLRNADIGPSAWTYIKDQGDRITHVGEVRKVCGMNEEKILRWVENQMMVYSVVRGPMPFSNHLASVLFTPEQDGQTKITWTFKFTPMCGMGPALRGMIENFFPIFLNRLESNLTEVPSA